MDVKRKIINFRTYEKKTKILAVGKQAPERRGAAWGD
jgi:hypothetical protein